MLAVADMMFGAARRAPRALCAGTPRAAGSFHTLVEMQRAACARYAESTLFWSKDPANGHYTRSQTFAEFGADVDHFRAALAARAGVSGGDKVACISANRAEWAVGCYAAMGLGAAYVPMYEQQRPEPVDFAEHFFRSNALHWHSYGPDPHSR